MWILQTSLLLALSSAPSGSEIEWVMPKPAETLPKLEPLLGWISIVQPDVSPSRAKKAFEPLGLSPFDPARFEAAGIDTKQSWVLFGDPVDPVVAVRARLSDQKRFDAAFEKLAKDPNVHALPGGVGVYAEASSQHANALLRDGAWARLQLARAEGMSLFTPPPKAPKKPKKKVSQWWKRADLVPLAKSRKVKRVRIPQTAKDADLTFRLGEGEDLKRGEGGVWLSKGTIDIRARLWPKEPVFLDKDKATALFDTSKLSLAAEALVRAEPRELIKISPEIPERAAELLEGSMHAVATPDGGVGVAIKLKKAPREKRIQAMLLLIEDENPGLKARYIKDKLVVLVFVAPLTEKTLTAALNEGKAAQAALELTVDPRRLLQFVMARGDARDLAVEKSQLMFVRMVLEPWLKRTERLAVSVTPVKRAVDARFTVKYRP